MQRHTPGFFIRETMKILLLIVTCLSPPVSSYAQSTGVTTIHVSVVDENNTLVGAILLSEIFPYLTKKNKLRGRVEEYMSRNVITCSPDDSIQKIHSLITDTEYVAFPVERKNELIGMVSRSDLIKYGKVRKSLVNAKKTTVEAFMTTLAITVSPNETIADAAEIMVRHDISRLPVVENGRIVGILDRHDVLKSMIM